MSSPLPYTQLQLEQMHKFVQDRDNHMAQQLAAMWQAIQSIADSMIKLQAAINRVGSKMAPWDENRYFQEPFKTNTSVASMATTQVVGDNPQRVALILAVGSGSGGNFSTDPNDGANLGITTTSFFTTVNLTQKDWGPLVTKAWYFNNPQAGPVNVTTWEMILREWPGR